MTSSGSGPWTEPGAYEVAPGVFRVPLPLPNDGLRAVNVYVLATPDGLVLVDAGWAIPESRRLLDEALASLDASVHDVRRFLVTHAHRDHYTQAVHVRRDVPGLRIGVGAGERPTIEPLQQPGRVPLQVQVDALRRVGAGPLADEIAALTHAATYDRGDWELPDEWLAAGPLDLGNRVLHAVQTPGHTAGHLVFHDLAGQLLFAGDHVLPTITPSIGFEPVLSPNPLGAFLTSLALVRARPDALLLPAHGPVAPSVHARVDELLGFHDERLTQTAVAVGQGASTPYEVAGLLGWTRRLRRLDELDPFNAMLATLETHAHLVLLAAQGRVSHGVENGVDRYVPA